MTDPTRPPGHLKIVHEALPDDARSALLDIVARTGRPMSAAESLGYSPAAYRKTLDADPSFAVAIQSCVAAYVEKLEEVADSRAVDGWEEPVFQQGILAGTITKYDHTLLMRRLEALAPERYRKNVSVDARVAAGVLVVPGTPLDANAWAAEFSSHAASSDE